MVVLRLITFAILFPLPQESRILIVVITLLGGMLAFFEINKPRIWGLGWLFGGEGGGEARFCIWRGLGEIWRDWRDLEGKHETPPEIWRVSEPSGLQRGFWRATPKM